MRESNGEKKLPPLCPASQTLFALDSPGSTEVADEGHRTGWTLMGRKAESSSKGPFGVGGDARGSFTNRHTLLRTQAHLHHGSWRHRLRLL